MFYLSHEKKTKNVVFSLKEMPKTLNRVGDQK
jgi:hypothetical protein